MTPIDFEVIMLKVKFKFKLDLFYNDYETSYTTYINHARWHRCLRLDGLCVEGNRSTQRKPTCLTWWPHDHLTCGRRESNPGRSSERRVRSHCASQTANRLTVKCGWRHHSCGQWWSNCYGQVVYKMALKKCLYFIFYQYT